MTCWSKICMAGLAVLLAGAARGQTLQDAYLVTPDYEEQEPWAVGARIGTLGAGLEVTARLNDHLNLRGAGNLGAFTLVGTFSDTEYDMDVELKNAGLMLDLYPTAEGSFRFSGGLYYNGNDFTGTATPQDETTIGDVEFTPEQIGTIHGDVDSDATAFYAGIGFGNPHDASEGHWTVTFDLGVLIMAGSPTIDLTADGTASSDPAFQAELAKEEKDIEDDLPRFWPVIMLGATYRF